MEKVSEGTEEKQASERESEAKRIERQGMSVKG